MLQFFLYKEHSNGSWALKGQSRATCALRHSKGTRALKALKYLVTQGTRALEGHLGTRALKALGHLASKGNLGTQTLGHGGIGAILFSRLIFKNVYNSAVKWQHWIVAFCFFSLYQRTLKQTRRLLYCWFRLKFCRL